MFSAAFVGEKHTAKWEETLSYMKESIASLSELLTSLLDISRLDAGIVKPSIAPIDVFQLIKRLSNTMEVEVKNKGLKLHVRGQPLWVNSDSVLLGNAVCNLLTNAIKYTVEGGVLIDCRPRKDEVWIEIWDTGIGIPVDELDNIFDEFYQVNNVELERKQGLGLGLSIVTREMDLLGHSFSLYSREGRGTMVRIKLQRVYFGSKTEPRLREELPDRLANKKVLIIDDEESILVATKRLVANWKCDIEIARNIDEASAICRNFVPDVIISDYRLQGSVTGIDVIKHLRSQISQHIPAILVTGDTALDIHQLAQDNKLMLLHKPLKPAKLRAAINMQSSVKLNN